MPLSPQHSSSSSSTAEVGASSSGKYTRGRLSYFQARQQQWNASRQQGRRFVRLDFRQGTKDKRQDDAEEDHSETTMTSVEEEDPETLLQSPHAATANPKSAFARTAVTPSTPLPQSPKKASNSSSSSPSPGVRRMMAIIPPGAVAKTHLFAAATTTPSIQSTPPVVVTAQATEGSPSRNTGSSETFVNAGVVEKATPQHSQQQQPEQQSQPTTRHQQPLTTFSQSPPPTAKTTTGFDDCSNSAFRFQAAMTTPSPTSAASPVIYVAKRESAKRPYIFGGSALRQACRQQGRRSKKKRVNDDDESTADSPEKRQQPDLLSSSLLSASPPAVEKSGHTATTVGQLDHFQARYALWKSSPRKRILPLPTSSSSSSPAKVLRSSSPKPPTAEAAVPNEAINDAAATEETTHDPAVRQRLIDFYQKYNPSKLSSIDATLERFRGRYDELFGKLEARYKFPIPQGTGPVCFLQFAGMKERVVIQLFASLVPKTAENFRALCAGNVTIAGKQLTYMNCKIHRVVKGMCLQGGDFTVGDGTGGRSIYQPPHDADLWGNFADETMTAHYEAGLLSMANKGPNTNGSQFFITTQPAAHLNGKHVVFGRVISGMDVVHQLEKVPVHKHNQRPIEDIVIADCGEVKDSDAEPTRLATASVRESPIKGFTLAPPPVPAATAATTTAAPFGFGAFGAAPTATTSLFSSAATTSSFLVSQASTDLSATTSNASSPLSNTSGSPSRLALASLGSVSAGSSFSLVPKSSPPTATTLSRSTEQHGKQVDAKAGAKETPSPRKILLSARDQQVMPLEKQLLAMAPPTSGDADEVALAKSETIQGAASSTSSFGIGVKIALKTRVLGEAYPPVSSGPLGDEKQALPHDGSTAAEQSCSPKKATEPDVQAIDKEIREVSQNVADEVPLIDDAVADPKMKPFFIGSIREAELTLDSTIASSVLGIKLQCVTPKLPASQLERWVRFDESKDLTGDLLVDPLKSRLDLVLAAGKNRTMPSVELTVDTSAQKIHASSSPESRLKRPSPSRVGHSTPVSVSLPTTPSTLNNSHIPLTPRLSLQLQQQPSSLTNVALSHSFSQKGEEPSISVPVSLPATPSLKNSRIPLTPRLSLRLQQQPSPLTDVAPSHSLSQKNQEALAQETQPPSTGISATPHKPKEVESSFLPDTGAPKNPQDPDSGVGEEADHAGPSISEAVETPILDAKASGNAPLPEFDHPQEEAHASLASNRDEQEEVKPSPSEESPTKASQQEQHPELPLVRPLFGTSVREAELQASNQTRPFQFGIPLHGSTSQPPRNGIWKCLGAETPTIVKWDVLRLDPLKDKLDLALPFGKEKIQVSPVKVQGEQPSPRKSPLESRLKAPSPSRVSRQNSQTEAETLPTPSSLTLPSMPAAIDNSQIPLTPRLSVQLQQQQQKKSPEQEPTTVVEYLEEQAKHLDAAQAEEIAAFLRATMAAKSTEMKNRKDDNLRSQAHTRDEPEEPEKKETAEPFPTETMKPSDTTERTKEETSVSSAVKEKVEKVEGGMLGQTAKSPPAAASVPPPRTVGSLGLRSQIPVTPRMKQQAEIEGGDVRGLRSFFEDKLNLKKSKPGTTVVLKAKGSEPSSSARGLSVVVKGKARPSFIHAPSPSRLAGKSQPVKLTAASTPAKEEEDEQSVRSAQEAANTPQMAEKVNPPPVVSAPSTTATSQSLNTTRSQGAAEAPSSSVKSKHPAAREKPPVLKGLKHNPFESGAKFVMGGSLSYPGSAAKASNEETEAVKVATPSPTVEKVFEEFSKRSVDSKAQTVGSGSKASGLSAAGVRVSGISSPTPSKMPSFGRTQPQSGQKIPTFGQGETGSAPSFGYTKAEFGQQASQSESQVRENAPQVGKTQPQFGHLVSSPTGQTTPSFGQTPPQFGQQVSAGHESSSFGQAPEEGAKPPIVFGARPSIVFGQSEPGGREPAFGEGHNPFGEARSPLDGAHPGYNPFATDGLKFVFGSDSKSPAASESTNDDEPVLPKAGNDNGPRDEAPLSTTAAAAAAEESMERKLQHDPSLVRLLITGNVTNENDVTACALERERGSSLLGIRLQSSTFTSPHVVDPLLTNKNGLKEEEGAAGAFSIGTSACFLYRDPMVVSVCTMLADKSGVVDEDTFVGMMTSPSMHAYL